MSATRDHGDRVAVGEVLLPVVQVDDQAEIVPGEHTCHASADFAGVDHLDVLVIRLPVDVEQFLPFLAQETRVKLFGHVLEGDGQREAAV